MICAVSPFKKEAGMRGREWVKPEAHTNGKQEMKMKMEMEGKEREKSSNQITKEEEGGGTWRFRLVRNDQEKPRKGGKSPSPATAV